MISVLIIEGTIKLVQKLRYNNKENVARVFNPRSSVPEAVLYESQTHPGVYFDEVNNKMFKELNGNWVAI